jgi:hypothetical protein
MTKKKAYLSFLIKLIMLVEIIKDKIMNINKLINTIIILFIFS